VRQYALDDRHVYYYGRIVKSADPKPFRNLPIDHLTSAAQAEQANEASIRNDFFRDDTYIYFYGRKLKEVDAASFILFQYPGFANIYGIDKEHAYCS
jgi:hypothetical protein